MDKQLAEKILQLGIESQRISNEKYDIQKKLMVYSWDEVSTMAMKFLLEAQDANTRGS